MKKSILLILAGVIITLLFFVIQGSVTGDKSDAVHDEPDYNQNNFQEIYSPPMPEELAFCGSPVPTNLYYVREAFERELIANCYLHGTTLQIIKRAQRYFPVIEPILKENKIPEDMKYLAVAESGLRNVVSPAKAEGIWQFMKETGKEYGLEVNGDVDERYHLEKATQAACDYMNKSYTTYNDWALVAAAYNAGNARILDFTTKQMTNDYYDLLTSTETSRYVYRILALKCILENPTKYGFYVRESEIYPIIPTEAVTIDTAIHSLADFALSHGISYKVLKEFNPWLRNTSLPNKVNKKYEIAIPKKGYLDYNKKLEAPHDRSWFSGY